MAVWSDLRRAGLIAWAALGLIASGGEPARAAGDVLNVDLVNEPATLDPHMQANHDSIVVYRNIFDNLLTRDDDGRIVPQIATAWRQISDTEIEFDIRQGVKFHDGTPLTAEDVVYSVRRITNPALRSSQLPNFNRIVGAELAGPDKVRLRTQTAYPVLLSQLVNLSIVPRAYVERVGQEAFIQNPIGSGPYRFVSWQRGQRVTLAANPDYWGERGTFARVEFNQVPDAAARMANLRTGRSDLIVTLTPDHAAELRNDRRAQAVVVLSERVAVLRMNTLVGPLTDIRLRRAVWHGIDRDLIVSTLLGGIDRVCSAGSTVSCRSSARPPRSAGSRASRARASMQRSRAGWSRKPAQRRSRNSCSTPPRCSTSASSRRSSRCCARSASTCVSPCSTPRPICAAPPAIRRNRAT